MTPPEKHDFCTGWRFAKGDCPEAAGPDFDDSAWEGVALPHTWNADDMRPGAPPEDAYVGPAWYRKRFRVEAVPDTRLMLLFEAVANYSDVWVDGAYVGGRDGGFLSFRLDVTDALGDGGEHVVAVRADNSFRSGSVPPELIDWERYGGIHRPAWLLRKGDAFFEHKSTRIRTPEVTDESATVVVRSSVRETRRAGRQLVVRHRILNAEGQVVCSAEEELLTERARTVPCCLELPPVDQPSLWSPEKPNLYRVESQLLDGDELLDRVVNPLGFRWFEFDPDNGFSLNGRPMKLLGADLHQDFPGLGSACPERFHRRDAELMKEAGLNFMRASHYPRNDRFLDACDELGIMVMEEQPYWHGSLRTRHGHRLLTNARRLLREMVAQHANHPSIVLWNTVNEIMIGFDPPPGWNGYTLPREEWPFARRCVAAMNQTLHRTDPDRPTSSVLGAKWRENEEAGIPYETDVVAYNGGVMHDTEDGHPAYDVMKEKDPRRISIMSEGILNDVTPMRADWDVELTAWECYAEHWSRIYRRDWFCGGAMWVFADYSARGTYRNMAMMDYSRLPYESYHFFRSQWTDRPMAHICGHWDWDEEPGTERRVVVFTNCEGAELFLNGKSQGVRGANTDDWPDLPHPPMEWTVPCRPGELKVVARAEGAEVTDVRITSDKPHAVELAAESDSLVADGQDVCFLTARVVDGGGNRCYGYFGEVEIDAEGTARLAGPKGVEVRGGLCRFAVRSTGEPGAVDVGAKAEGLEPAQVSLEAVPQ